MARPLYSQVKIRRPRIIERDLSKETRFKEDVLGYCIKEIFEIYIEKNQGDKSKCKSYIHELCHALLPDLNEMQILRVEHYLGETLWNYCIRKIIKKYKNKCNKPRQKK